MFENKDFKSDLFQVTGLWASKDKHGRDILTAKLGRIKIMILANSNKRQDKHPDYYLYVGLNKEFDNNGN